ncbi:hypothetical protein [Leptospira mayottensis]|uniref:hypothetical protein n=1 Tax=Leptospira mayottensis TaxID=1137606 RepID=UPI000E35C783|nr:hypothetical protein [Leptospira mayottensis]AXR68913.1 hypothetical protein DPV73_13765 [Leptospira mayottensis]
MDSIPNFLIIQKNKIPRGFSHPLKTSELISAYDSAEINIETFLNYNFKPPYFRVEFWPPNPNINHERLNIDIGAVPTESAHVARKIMKFKIIPEFIKWTKNVFLLPVNSPKRYQRLFWEFKIPTKESI